MVYGETAPRDENQVTALLATNASTGDKTVKVYANPITHRLLVDLGSGVTGPGASTDNAVVRWDGATGIVIKNSVVLIGDTGAVTGVTTLTASGAIDGASFKVGGVSGADGTFTSQDGKTVTVVKGLITSIV